MTGWKTWAAAISAFCAGIIRIIEGATTDPIDMNKVYEGILTCAGGLGLVGIGHKLEKQK